jgi:hypothetical protein
MNEAVYLKPPGGCEAGAGAARGHDAGRPQMSMQRFRQNRQAAAQQARARDAAMMRGGRK